MVSGGLNGLGVHMVTIGEIQTLYSGFDMVGSEVSRAGMGARGKWCEG